jgi:hypothetical protein
VAAEPLATQDLRKETSSLGILTVSAHDPLAQPVGIEDARRSICPAQHGKTGP